MDMERGGSANISNRSKNTRLGRCFRSQGHKAESRPRRRSERCQQRDVALHGEGFSVSGSDIEWASAQVPPTPLIGGGYCREREGDGQQDRHMAVCFSSLWPCRRFCVRAWRLLGYLLHRSWADFWRSWKVWRV